MKDSQKQLIFIGIFVVACTSIGVYVSVSKPYGFSFILIALGLVTLLIIIRIFRNYKQLKKLEDSPEIPHFSQQSQSHKPTPQPIVSEHRAYSSTFTEQPAKQCTNCGASIGPNDSFCQSCGTEK